MDKSTGSPSLAHMALLYGPRAEQELDAAIGPFIRLRDEYRERWRRTRHWKRRRPHALTQDEAAAAYRLMAPLYAPDMTDEEAVRVAAMNAIAFPCFKTGGYGFRGPAVKAILEGFERAIPARTPARTPALYIQHHGEAEAREVDSWTRFILYEALKLFVAVQDAHLRAGISIVGELRADLDRVRAILATLTVTRPRGRYDARLTLRRDTYIVTMLCELAECGLPVTSHGGASLAGALAEALDDRVSESTIRDVWKECPSRDRSFNDALPDELRMPESLILRSREYFAAGVRCEGCGEVGKVPKWRADRLRLCLHCAPPFGNEN